MDKTNEMNSVKFECTVAEAEQLKLQVKVACDPSHSPHQLLRAKFCFCTIFFKLTLRKRGRQTEDESTISSKQEVCEHQTKCFSAASN